MATASGTGSPDEILSTLLEQVPIIKSAELSQDRENKRRIALATARNLVASLERPEETAFTQAFETHTRQVCLRLAIDLKIFHILNGLHEKSISSASLSEQCNAEEMFVIRIMRIVTAMGYAIETAERAYAATGLSKAMTNPAIEACMIHSFETTARIQVKMPEYFKNNGYKCPTDIYKGPFQYAFDTDLSFFQFIHQYPERMKIFNTYMTGNRAARKHWVDWFPVRSELLDDFKAHAVDGSVLLVDMGGGKGHDLERLIATFPEAHGKVVLQDLPGTIANLKDFGGAINPMVHDIFTTQPVYGAKAYYTHFLLHDFPDEKCKVILSHVAKAMKPGFSRLLLNESLLPEKDCPIFFAAADITMMSGLAGLNRSERQWVALVESAGLTVAKIWTSPDTGDCEVVLEAVLSVENQ